MNGIVKEHILSTLAKGTRFDGRKFDAYREITIERGISPKSAEGSVRVCIGETEVVAGVKFGVGTPYPDSPDEGTIMVNMELSPLASPEFESGPPSIQSIELARVVDRPIRESGALDFKKLCITKGEKCWMVFIDIYPINDAGNLFDAAALAALAALMDAKYPKLEKDQVVYGELTNKKLISDPLPMSCTVYKIGKELIIDPTNTEEAVIDARLTVGVAADGKICALQKGGEESLKPEDIKKITDLAFKKVKEIRKVLDGAYKVRKG